ncbi:tyrosine protein phosphatase [Bacillus sp. ISL-40]|uniref:tyrosine-protein phosphatase n=1 Tax=unclassified Bacillus (in: firmicutes) TaxID=185979 RepID=UPI001BE90C50|nr:MULTISPECIES: CpsB/CapC family capsule biosynthesis tyrosine phosphatase [unclassified Bacillus (in: firmicutes)]MBT2701010.1 tyrosine protein phosphatase [Bacillus sp. ISL-40]MBT2739334.1 tyrosine protein phosphatase [Bacillus sp. ISL-77]
MIDLHCHILPGIDDGARDLSESVKMAQKAVEQGIHTIVATPHHMNNRYENPKQTIIDRVRELNKVLIDEKIDLKVLPGQETRIYGEMVDGYETGEILPIDHTQYVLVEFSSSHVPRYTEKLFYDLQTKGLIPVIVHPERNQEIIERPERLYQLVEKGALTQVTAASVCGDFGKKIKTFSLQLIEANLTHFIASDAHNTSNRTFKMKEAFSIIQAKYGNDIVFLFKENAELVIEGSHVYKEVPVRIKKKKFFNIF